MPKQSGTQGRNSHSISLYNRVVTTDCKQAEVTVWSNSATEEVVLQASASVDSLEGNHCHYNNFSDVERPVLYDNLADQTDLFKKNLGLTHRFAKQASLARAIWTRCSLR